jgi:hypothetical protein
VILGLFLMYFFLLEKFFRYYIFHGYKIYNNGFIYNSKPRKIVYWKDILRLNFSRFSANARIPGTFSTYQAAFYELVFVTESEERFIISDAIENFPEVIDFIMVYAKPFIKEKYLGLFLAEKKLDFSNIQLSQKGFFYRNTLLAWTDFDRLELKKSRFFYEIYAKNSLEPWAQILKFSIFNVEVFIYIIETMLECDKDIQKFAAQTTQTFRPTRE